MSQLFDLQPERPGYRLQRLEVYNWGTFDSSDGKVFRFDPQGRTSLLVGHNGSGKSTLVDAITTLFVDKRSRTYNVAAGAKRAERTPKSYIKGAYDRAADESMSSVEQFLRPKGNHLTAISAVFRDEQLLKSFTLTQVLFLKTDSSDDKVYAIADSDRSLADDLQGLIKSDQIRAHLNKAGYQTTKAYNEYLGWLTKRTRMRGKAVDMFNQTVAVKNIESLNVFIRKHMLESQNWREKIQSLLTHFHDLSTAHQELVRARWQVELLEPIHKLGTKYRQRADQVDQLERQLAAARSYFPDQLIRLFEPEIARANEKIGAIVGMIKRLDEELELTRENIRQLKNEIDLAGGERLKQLPGLIERETLRLHAKQQAHNQFHDQLRECSVKGEVSSAERLEKVRGFLHTVVEKTNAKVLEIEARREAAIGTRAGLQSQLAEEEAELAALMSRRTNLPLRFTAMRRQICENLNLDESVLPFAAELISVLPDQRRWESSAEMVLNSFALSLLVPRQYYQRVRSYVEHHRINDEKGEGGRLDYIHVGDPSESQGDRIAANSLFHKLRFKPGHTLTPWVQGEVMRRFNFRCCESVDEFNDVSGMALTENRHVKLNAALHKKDDRRRRIDPRYFVLGWDNTEKKQRIAAHIEELKGQTEALNQSIEADRRNLAALSKTLQSAEQALLVDDFDIIDVACHAEQIKTLRAEKRELEETNDAVKTLRNRLKAEQSKETEKSSQRDDRLADKTNLERQIAQAEANIKAAKAKLRLAEQDGSWQKHIEQFDAITATLGEPVLSIENFDSKQKEWNSNTRNRVDEQREPLQKLGEEVVSKMATFLREFKEEQDDLDSTLEALDSFLGLLEQLREEDLPRHIKKFKERLNEQVTHEVALFNTALREERKEIEQKIYQLNRALASVQYDQLRGTYMQLDPRPVQDREIDDFRRSLRECLDESLETSEDANETRFYRIKALVERLADKEKATWRNKVVDVRNWYDFAALEIERDTGATKSCYDGSSGQSGGEKAKLAFTILVAALAYQFDVDPSGQMPGRFQFVVVDEMFSKIDDQNAKYALQLFKQFGLQLLIVAPLDAKAIVTGSFVDRYLHVVKDADTNHSQLFSMTAQEYDEVVQQYGGNGKATSKRRSRAK